MSSRDVTRQRALFWTSMSRSAATLIIVMRSDVRLIGRSAGGMSDTLTAILCSCAWMLGQRVLPIDSMNLPMKLELLILS